MATSSPQRADARLPSERDPRRADARLPSERDPLSANVKLPSAIGPLTERLFTTIRGTAPARIALAAADVTAPDTNDVLSDDDLQLTLYVLYELHYRGFRDVDEGWEWEPSLLELRRQLEDHFERALLEATGSLSRSPAPVTPQPPGAQPPDVDLALRAIIDADSGRSLSRYIERRASREQLLEFAIHRSAYQLKEADPHSWAIPRLDGQAKAALIAIQSDEYGEGMLERMHSELFRQTLIELGLSGDYGAYLALLPGTTLATVNLMSLLGLHRRWRGAIVGHLAAFEMTSSLPNRRYANGLRRLGYGPRACAFYDEHVIADAVHENLAAVDLAGGLARAEPRLVPDILFGAAALVALDRRFVDHLLGAWEAGRSSLRGQPVDGA